eukprot:TRINITY_DN573_c0_g1_i1.p1 TRINITY_DN573_c0_g1~~TRINITY_DN573_c0_g1_i1.p1  ORF type:complete len:117 (+),score=13.14 TRINITY_DN573_c0_g1_i1:477-827(+)
MASQRWPGSSTASSPATSHASPIGFMGSAPFPTPTSPPFVNLPSPPSPAPIPHPIQHPTISFEQAQLQIHQYLIRKEISILRSQVVVPTGIRIRDIPPAHGAESIDDYYLRLRSLS